MRFRFQGTEASFTLTGSQEPTTPILDLTAFSQIKVFLNVFLTDKIWFVPNPLGTNFSCKTCH